MKTIIVKNQAEWDALPEKFAELTAVHVYVDPGEPLTLKRQLDRAVVSIRGGVVESIRGGVVESIEGGVV